MLRLCGLRRARAHPWRRLPRQAGGYTAATRAAARRSFGAEAHLASHSPLHPTPTTRRTCGAWAFCSTPSCAAFCRLTTTTHNGCTGSSSAARTKSHPGCPMVASASSPRCSRCVTRPHAYSHGAPRGSASHCDDHMSTAAQAVGAPDHGGAACPPVDDQG